ncbi:MAG: TadE/TadG family type IV pilus assembly protein [Rubrimonas sp.]|uniref:TadE/TadG family type IV pilus assembly protein n=1 Tax=Rubrimonas sp. TaxID=2036015 RepID=UPI002FDC8D7E
MTRNRTSARRATPCRGGALRFLRRRDGVSAVEFALLAPVLITMLLGLTEVGRYIYLRLKIVNIASNVSEVIARAEVVRATELDSLFSAMPVMLRPFEAGGRFAVVVTGVVIPAAGDPATVAWQRTGGGLTVASAVGAPGGEADVPADLAIPGGEAVVVAEVFYDYEAWLLGFAASQQVRETAFARPRRSALGAME